MEFETYTYRTKIQIGGREVDRLWTLRKNTQDEFIVKEVYEDNCYKLPDDLSGKVIVDIGANIGAFAAACVDRNSSLAFCYDPNLSLATKLFPYPVCLSQYAIVGENGPNFVPVLDSTINSIEDGSGNIVFLTGGSNTFSGEKMAATLQIDTCLATILTDESNRIWLKLDCEGSEYEILASDLPWSRIERIFGECHTLIDGKLSRDTSPIENGRFPIEPNVSSLVNRLVSCGFRVETLPNHDDRHLHLFWAFNRKTLEKIVDRSTANEHDAERLQMAREDGKVIGHLYPEIDTALGPHDGIGVITRQDGLKSGPIEDEEIYDTHGSLGSISKAMEYAEQIEKMNQIVSSQAKETSEKIDRMISSVEGAERARLERSNWKPAIPEWNKKDGWINAPRGVKTVCVLTPFRNARRYLPLYFRQLTSLRDLLSQNNYSLRLVAAEGDSLDGTRERIVELSESFHIPLTMVDTTHGHMKWGSVEDPVRMRVMSEVMNKALDEVKESDSVVVWIMSDLEWEAETLIDMIHAAMSDRGRDFSVFAPLVLLPDLDPYKGPGENARIFYDTWAFRGTDGTRFKSNFPWHPLEDDLTLIGSAGTCLVMPGSIARTFRATDQEAVSFCKDVRKGGYLVAVGSRWRVYHAPKQTYSILWISDAVCISGFSRVAHSLFPLLSEAGFNLEIIAQNYYGTPHNFPYLIWPANVNGEDLSGTLRMQNLLWANRKKYNAVVVLDDPWNVPRVTRGVQNVTKLIREEEKSLDKKNLYNPPPIISWVTVDGKNVRGIDLVGTHVISATEFGKEELGFSEQVTEITYDYTGWAEQISVVPFGVDSSIFKPLDKLECRKLTCGDGSTVPYDSFIVGTVSNNQLRKNLHLVIESFSEWVRRYGRLDAYLYLCLGKESDTGCNVESLVRYYDLRNKVIVNRSALPDEILAKVYNSFDLFISLSNEGFGLCALEAMSCGVPCVLSDWSGYSSWVPNDAAIKIPCSHTQLTAPLNSQAYVIGGVADKGRVVSELQKLYTFSEMREKLSVGGRKLAREFNWKNTADKLVNVLERIIEREAIKGEDKHICSPENGCGIESSKPFVSEFPCTCGNFPLCDTSCEYRIAQEGAPING